MSQKAIRTTLVAVSVLLFVNFANANAGEMQIENGITLAITCNSFSMVVYLIEAKLYGGSSVAVAGVAQSCEVNDDRSSLRIVSKSNPLNDNAKLINVCDQKHGNTIFIAISPVPLGGHSVGITVMHASCK